MRLSRSIDLAIAGGLDERRAAAGDLGVALVEIGDGVQPVPLDALHPRLGGEEVGAGRPAAQHGVAARVAGGGGGVRRLADQRLAAHAVRQLAGEILARGLFGTLAQ